MPYDELTERALRAMLPRDLADTTADREPELDEIRSMAARVAGHDVTPGHDELHHYWTRDPEGLGRWKFSPKPWTTLVEQLVEHAHVPPEVAKVWASRWFIEVFGYAAGSDKNRVAHGHPPRGKKIGPG